MEKTPKNQDKNVDGNNETVLEEMPSFEEHMESIESKTDIDKKYYEMAREEKKSWIEGARRELEKAKQLKPDKFKILTNPEILSIGYSGEKRPIYRPYDENNESDVKIFNKHKTNEITSAERYLELREGTDLDKLAQCFRNEEIMNDIAEKLKNNEEFTPEEIEFLGDGPISDEELFDTEKYLTPEKYFVGFYEVPPYDELLDKNDRWRAIKDNPLWAAVAQAQIREMAKKDRAMLHNSEEIQNSLKDMQWRRAVEPFYGETNINTATGEARTFTAEDNYPQLEKESDAEYRGRMRKIGRMEKLWNKRH